MPYKGKELSMLIFLPSEMADSTTGLETVGGTTHTCTIGNRRKRQNNNWFCIHLQLEKQLTYENFVEWTRPDMMDEQKVRVGLPRFKMEEKYDLKEVLISMGMVDAFNVANSDFSGRTCGWTNQIHLD